ncbi:sugar phosphate permease [Alicyclobacillus sacchari]|uniref:Sugar phosphate permease n=1 Tax=Alicyclobacillus sacchari TaxID=392010 RepID=A0A4R8LTF8_9BACL|nr:MFS transporter [Alicyclobacillus sacchari]TDY50065.1 sugar phosphate permease [Alicyclobacillus sacchari]GMA57592.1 MFS transporter [Alicyclobacillus sacchari]
MEQQSFPRSRWSRLIPAIFVTYSLAYLDRSNYGLGAAAGLKQALHMNAASSSLLASLFFLGYFFFQVPGAHYAKKYSAKKLVFWALILWGIFASLQGLITNLPLLYVDRFLLGIVESVVMPAMLIFISHWFTNGERSRANTFLILGNPITVLWMSVISGYLIQWFHWQGMFVIEGVPSIIWAFIWWAVVKDKPEETRWLTREEQQAVTAALAAEQEGMAQVKSYREAFSSRSVVLLSLQYFFWSIGVYGFVLWLPSMIKAASHVGIVSTGWLSSVPYLLAAILMMITSFLSDRRPYTRKVYVWVSLLIGAVAFYLSYILGSGHFTTSFILLVIAGGAMYAPYGPFFAIVPEILPSNVAGVAMALINCMGALGSFVGSYFVGYLNNVTGGPNASYVFMALSLVLAVLLTMAVRVRRPSTGLQQANAGRPVSR